MNAGGESYSGMQHLFTFPWIRINPWRHNLFCCTYSKHGTIPHIEFASCSKMQTTFVVVGYSEANGGGLFFFSSLNDICQYVLDISRSALKSIGRLHPMPLSALAHRLILVLRWATATAPLTLDLLVSGLLGFTSK